MRLNKLIKIGTAVENIVEESDCTIPDVVDALIGICWDEENAEEIKAYHADEDDV